MHIAITKPYYQKQRKLTKLDKRQQNGKDFIEKCLYKTPVFEFLPELVLDFMRI